MLGVTRAAAASGWPGLLLLLLLLLQAGPGSCLPLAVSYEEMWQLSPAPEWLPGGRVYKAQSQGLAHREPQQPVQVRQTLLPTGPEAWIKGPKLGLCQGLAGFQWEGDLVGKEAVLGGRDCGKSFEGLEGRRPGMGAPGAGRRPLEPGWARDERGMSPPRPPTTKQDVLEGTRALACQPVPRACLCHLVCSTTTPQPCLKA